MFLVQICAEETEEKCVNRLSLCLREVRNHSWYCLRFCLISVKSLPLPARLQGESFTAGFMQAVLSLILPLVYEFNPGLVLGVVRDSGAKTHLAPVWGHLTSLLQGLAGGQMLTLLQVRVFKYFFNI